MNQVNQKFQNLSIKNAPSSSNKSPEKSQAKLYKEIAHNPGNKRSFQCLHPGCEKVFQYKSEVESHSVIHKTEKTLQCQYPGCGKSFKRSDALKNHVKTSHMNNQIFNCPLPDCDFLTKKKEGLHVHMTKHQVIQSCAFKSPDDGKIYLPWKRVVEWERKWWAKHKVDFRQNKTETMHDMLSELTSERLRRDWDIISCLEEEDTAASEKLVEKLDDLEDDIETRAISAYLNETPCLVTGARDLMRTICRQIQQENEENKRKMSSFSNKTRLSKEKSEAGNYSTSPGSEAYNQDP